ncbi:hypothetical protein BC828DRAFT_398952 [Blastocladiella britannica]|nr:hypothetical protein BC828DRAFT_398952 [Blastocladiella britannica]
MSDLAAPVPPLGGGSGPTPSKQPQVGTLDLLVGSAAAATTIVTTQSVGLPAGLAAALPMSDRAALFAPQGPASPKSPLTPTSPVPVIGRLSATEIANDWATSTTDSLPNGWVVIDTRPPEEYSTNHVRGSFNAFAAPLLARRWLKQSGSMSAGTPVTAAGAAAGGTPGTPMTLSRRVSINHQGAASPGSPLAVVSPTTPTTPGTPGMGGSTKSINIESLVIPPDARDAYRLALAAATRAVVLGATEADTGAPGSVPFMLAAELSRSAPHLTLLGTVEGGWAALGAAVAGACAARLSDPSAAAGMVVAAAAAAQASGGIPGSPATTPGGGEEGAGTAAFGKRGGSFSLRTTNLRTSMTAKRQGMGISVAPSISSSSSAAGAAAAAGDSGSNNGGRAGPAHLAATLVEADEAASPRSAHPDHRPTSFPVAAQQSISHRTAPATTTSAPLAPSTSNSNLNMMRSSSSRDLLTPFSADEEDDDDLAATPQLLDPSWIMDGLYLGPDLFGHNPAAAVDALRAIGVRAVLNMAFECVPPTAEEMQRTGIDRYLKIGTQDCADERIEAVLREATEFVDLAQKDGLVVYVHCKAGKSRSATVVMAHLILHKGYGFQASWDHVKKMRPAVAPNIGFLGVLKELGQEQQEQVNGIKLSMVGGAVQPAPPPASVSCHATRGGGSGTSPAGI